MHLCHRLWMSLSYQKKVWWARHRQSFTWYTLIKFWRYNKVNFATSAFGQTLADFTRNVINHLGGHGANWKKIIRRHAKITFGGLPKKNSFAENRTTPPRWLMVDPLTLARISNGTISPRPALLFRQNFMRVCDTNYRFITCSFHGLYCRASVIPLPPILPLVWQWQQSQKMCFCGTELPFICKTPILFYNHISKLWALSIILQDSQAKQIIT